MSLLFDEVDGRAYRVGGALPRAYVVTACERAANASAALGPFVDPAFDATRAVLVETGDNGEAGCSEPGESSSGRLVGQARIVTRSLNSLSIQGDTPEAGWLVIAESWDPGWQAPLDGTPTGLVPGDYAFRALRVPVGAHTVELHYLPRSFVIGAAISALSVAALVTLNGGWWWRNRQRERSSGTPG
ncbi:MAG TPA: YfhO family protein [Chloroflexota bacterium]|jgi:hypothetical protein